MDKIRFLALTLIEVINIDFFLYVWITAFVILVALPSVIALRVFQIRSPRAILVTNLIGIALVIVTFLILAKQPRLVKWKVIAGAFGIVILFTTIWVFTAERVLARLLLVALIATVLFDWAICYYIVTVSNGDWIPAISSATTTVARMFFVHNIVWI